MFVSNNTYLYIIVRRNSPSRRCFGNEAMMKTNERHAELVSASLGMNGISTSRYPEINTG
jgi:hypothetical protein